MSTDKLEKRITTAQEALRSFLATLLGTDAPLKIAAPVPADFDKANEQSMQDIAFTAGTSKEDHWAVVMDPEWLPLLSKSMLGEPIEFGEPGADDLLKELAAQAYGAVRTQLASAGVTLPEAAIRLMGGDEELGGHRFSPVLHQIAFEFTVEGQTFGGFALVPPISDEPGPIEADETVAAGDEADGGSDPGPVESEAFADPEPEGGSQPTAQTPGAGQPKTGQGPAAGMQPSVQVQPAAFPDLGIETLGGDGGTPGFELLAEVELEVTVELGRRSIPLADVLRLTTGSVIELDKLVGEPLEVYANGRLIAEGEAVVMDEQFGIRITSLASGKTKAKAFV